MTHQPANSIPETGDVLDRLNPVERDLLGLLGRGHTAKSIATLRSMSEAAVNERFRSARRKTGIGSSREIARLIVARENRHDLIDLARPAAPPPELPRPEAPHRASPQRWRLPMAAAVLLAAAILAQQTAVPPPGRSADLAQAAFSVQTPAPDVAALHAQVIAGRPDPSWSAVTEAALSDLYQRQRTFSGTTESFEVTCNASLCEVLAVSRPGLSDAEISALIETLQTREIYEASTALKMNLEVQHFTSMAETPRKIVFAAYWRRTD